MIEPVLVRRLSAITLFLALATSALALALGHSRVAAGLISGAALGLLPIWSWSYLGSKILPNPHRAEAPRSGAKADGFLISLLTLAKFSLYGIALFLLISRNIVDPLAFAGALLAPGFLMAAIVATRRAGAAR